MGWDARFCFTVYQHIEQTEAGDTYTHTFTWPGWVDCNTRYFYFIGTTGGLDSLSESPIFWLHYLWVELPPYVNFYSDPHPELNTCDGWVSYDVGCPQCSWAELRDGPGDSNSTDANALIHQIFAFRNPGEWSSLFRSILLFDTSAIGIGKTILAARLRVKTKANQLDAAGWAPGLCVVTALPAQTFDLGNPDYATLGEVKLSDVRSWASFVPEVTLYFTLNPLGLAEINPTGITKLGIREAKYDLPNIAPPWVAFGIARIDLYSVDNVLEPRKPTLQVAFV